MTHHRDLILLSGGIDSTTALADSVDHHTATHCLSVGYGQRHTRELDSAQQVAHHYGMPHETLDLTGWGALLTGSALTDTAVDIPPTSYDAASMSTTVVPARNAALATLAAGVAESRGCTRVVLATHSGDHHLYPDCRPEFIDSIRTSIELATDHAITLTAPFLHADKTTILQRGLSLEAPYALTWSCYEGKDRPCGQCGTCRERAEAFTAAGSSDPALVVA